MKVVQCWDDGVVDDVRLTGLLRWYRARFPCFAMLLMKLDLHRPVK